MQSILSLCRPYMIERAFDPTIVRGTPTWPAFRPTCVAFLDMSGRPLLPCAPHAHRATTYICVLDVDMFARDVLHNIDIDLEHAISPLEAYDLGRLIDAVITPVARAAEHAGAHGLLRGIRRLSSPVAMGQTARRNRERDLATWQNFWAPRTPPMTPKTAEDCLDLAHAIKPLTHGFLQLLAARGARRSFGQVYAAVIGVHDPNDQVWLLSEPRTVDAARLAARRIKQERRDGR